MIENQEIVNPVAMMQTLNNNKDWDKFVGSVWGELEVFENLTFKTSLSTDMAFWGERNWFPVSYLCYMVKIIKRGSISPIVPLPAISIRKVGRRSIGWPPFSDD